MGSASCKSFNSLNNAGKNVINLDWITEIKRRCTVENLPCLWIFQRNIYWSRVEKKNQRMIFTRSMITWRKSLEIKFSNEIKIVTMLSYLSFTYLRVSVDATSKDFVRPFLQIRLNRKCSKTIATGNIMYLKLTELYVE